MVTSVNVSPPLSPQSITVCTVVANIDCGPVNYALDSTYSYLTFDSVTKTLTAISTSAADIGVKNVNLIATLASYSSVTLTMPFTVTITACQITAFASYSIHVIDGAAVDTQLVDSGSYNYVIGSAGIVVYFYQKEDP